jgi:hypothetical protein
VDNESSDFRSPPTNESGDLLAYEPGHEPRRGPWDGNFARDVFLWDQYEYSPAREPPKARPFRRAVVCPSTGLSADGPTRGLRKRGTDLVVSCRPQRPRRRLPSTSADSIPWSATVDCPPRR